MPRRFERLTSLRVALALATATLACTANGEVCPQVEAPPRAASTGSAWVEVTAPRDVSLLQAAARVVLTGDRQAVLRPLYRAQISRFHVQAGDRVRVGQGLVDVVMPEVVAAAATYMGASRRSGAQAARRDKLTALRGEGLVAEGAVFDIASRTAETEQQVALAAATLRAAGQDPSNARELVRRPAVTLTSPIDGVVRELGGRLGEIVEGQGPPVALIVGEGRPRIEARFLHAPPPGATMRFVAVDGSVWPLRGEPVARAVEPDDGAVVMWFEVAEDERRAFAGLRGTVECFSDDPTLVQVPAGALGRDERGLLIYRQEAGGSATVPVELVMMSGASALVRARGPEPLRAGMRVAEDARAHERSQAGRAGEGA